MKNLDFSLSVQYAAAVDAAEMPPLRARVRAWVRAALTAGGGNDGSDLTVRFVDDAESADYNRRYRGRERSTNVLSFDYGAVNGRLQGDIVICAPLVRREAGDFGVQPKIRYAHLIVHGVLHLCGYRHDTAMAAERMEALEKEVLARFGIALPYYR